MRKTFLLIAMSALLAAGCSGDKGAGAAKAGGSLKGAGGVALDGKEVSIAGVTVKAPGVWKDFGPSGMRAASYAFGPIGGDADSATVAVFYFGKQGGGAIEANFDRWLGQMAMPGGGDPSTSAKRADGTADGMPFHHMEVAGTYNGAAMSGGMGGMGAGSSARPGYFMSAAVLEGPEGSLFFKLTGPEKTARAMNAAFLTMLQAARKAK
ncbi:MAG: hypothetical protein ACYDIE_06190 [Candidatus Krumholzibacteriia bacterium]